MRRRLAALFEDVDVLAWPTVPAVAPPLEAPLVELPSGTTTADQANVRGAGARQPDRDPRRSSVPVGLGADSLPIGLQLQAAWGRRRAAARRRRGAGAGKRAALGRVAAPAGARRTAGGVAMAAIVVEGLERAFDDVLAVQGVDLEVEEGEIYGFLGPNGAGKTTTVRMLTTLLLPTGGRATVAGHDVVAEARAVRRHDRGRPAGGGPRPADDRPRADPAAGDAAGAAARRGQAPRRRPARAGRPRRRRRPPRRRLLGRDAAAPRPRRRAGPRAARPLPRRADHRPRPGQPQNDLGGGAGR